MTTGGDPYRTLGLTPGASANEIRSAYRRLAKRYHPDFAGERAVPRFLAIQAAYEALIDGNGNLRRSRPGWPARGGASGGAARPGGADGGGPRPGGEPWRADPGRAQASRDAWRTRRTNGAGDARSTRADGATGRGRDGDGPAGDRTGASASGGPGADAGPGRRGGGPEHHWRFRRTARPGSTSYDEAGDTPLDPSWDGGTWYGASSGTYWTLNPREYADPRKHGPEYRRRAWRAAGMRGPAQAPSSASGSEERGRSAGDPATTAAPERAFDGGAPDAPGPGRDRPVEPRSSAGASTTDTAPVDRDLVADLLPEHLLARAEGPVVGRVLVAGIAAAPVPLVAGILLGALAGCSPGTCPPLVPLLALLAWPTAALVLAAVPVLSALGAFAVLLAGGGALLSGAIVATFSGDLAGAAWQALGSVGVVLYGFGLVIGAARLFVRREPDLPGP